MAFDATDIASRYRFLLSAMGLQFVKSSLYVPGEQLNSHNSTGNANDSTNGGFTVSHSDKGDPNMHTGGGRPPMSELGTPVFSDMLLSSVDRKDFTWGQEDVETNKVHLLRVLCDVEQTKNIVKTAIQGRNGTVKEYISDGDYIITIRGAITRSYKSNYPKEEMKIFLDLLKQQKSLKVTSEYLMQFGIYEVVVDSYKMGQESGRQNTQTFEINMCSDAPLLLKKKTNVRS